jgi:hypothetical protein
MEHMHPHDPGPRGPSGAQAEDRVDGLGLIELDEPGSDERLLDKLREFIDEHKIRPRDRREAKQFVEDLQEALKKPGDEP